MGFSKALNPKFNMDLDGGVAGLGHRAVGRLPVDHQAFARWFADMDELA